MTSRTGALLFAALALLAAALHPGVVDNVDSRIVLRTAERLVDARTWALAEDPSRGHWIEYGAIDRDGGLQMKFGAGNALLAVPFLLLGRAVLGPLGLDPARAGEAAVALSSCLWYGLCGVLVLRIARRVATERAAVGAALLHAVASYALVYGRSAYLETPLTACVLLAYDAALAARERPESNGPAWTLGAAAGAVLWIKHAAVLLLVGILTVLLVGARSRGAAARTLLRAAVPAGILAAGWMALNAARFGHPLSTGYAGSAKFDTPLVEGVLDLLVSERGGLVLFAPCAVLGLAGLPLLARRDRGLAWGIGLAFVLVLPLYATFFSPFGGDAWGPRYLVPNCALLAVPAAVGMGTMLGAGGPERFAAAAVVTVGVAFQVPPAVVSFTEVWTVGRRTDVAEPYPLPRAASRLLAAKVSGSPEPGALARVHRHSDPWAFPATPSLDLWPNRAAADLPRHASLAWAAWGGVAAACAACAAVVARRVRVAGVRAP